MPQIVTELGRLCRLGHRCHVDFLDDNSVGHKIKAKEILKAGKDRYEERGKPP